MLPLVSIIIPVYNIEPYLRECLDSVINQTMREIQIICVNDGSTDGSPAILEEYAAKDARVLVINKENGGVAAARNTAFSYVAGEYILFVDSDDTVDLRLCEKVYTKAEQSNADFVFFFYDEPKHIFLPPNFRNITSDDKITHKEKKQMLNYCGICGKLWRSDFLKKHNLTFDENLHFGEDALFYQQHLVLAEKISIVPEVLYHYQARENSLTTGYGKNMMDNIQRYTLLKSFLKEKGVYQSYSDWFVRNKINTLFHFYQLVKKKYKEDYIKKLIGSLDNDDIQFLRKGRHGAPEALYFYYKLTGDRYIFFKSVKKYIQQFPERYVIRPIVHAVRKIIKKQ
ncbi:MAG: glycosyltransferase [Planctomycetaceae bacterium]|jgi:glycosyltransferase involved in cell wall biosynthesis|nr:glycosyltransferase [Planctomycetaceae bacterium]